MSPVDESGVLNEDLDGKLDVILEYVKDIPEIKYRLSVVESDVSEIKSDITVIKGVIREHSADITELKSISHRH